MFIVKKLLIYLENRMFCKSFLKKFDKNVSAFVYNMKGNYEFKIIINTIK